MNRQRPKPTPAQNPDAISAEAWRCRLKFLRFFSEGFADEKYISWERGYKWNAHTEWEKTLNQKEHKSLLQKKNFSEIASRAVRLESRTNLLFSFEKMAVRDAIKTRKGAELFSTGLYDLLYGKGKPAVRFERWIEVVGRLPRKQTRVLTWPVVTVFGFIARPDEFIFLKPNVTRKAASEYGAVFNYVSKPNWATYESLLHFASRLRSDLADLRPVDLIDIQSFIWTLGSDEYKE